MVSKNHSPNQKLNILVNLLYYGGKQEELNYIQLMT